MGRTVACPDCGTKTVVRAPAELPPKPKRPDPGEYGLGEPAAPAPSRASTAAQRLILVVCSLCGTRMHLRVEHGGRRVRCPDCGRVNPVPHYQRSKQAEAAPDLVKGEYEVGTAAPQGQPMPERFSKPPPPSIEPVELTPPRWTFFSGVYGFPWNGEAAVRWAYLTLGILAAGLIAWFALGKLLAAGAGRETVLGAGALGIVVFFFCLWTLSFASACLIVVVEETAGGGDSVRDWPSSDWRDWLPRLMSVLFLGGLSALIARGMGSLVGAAGGDERAIIATRAAVTFLMFPFWILSALESDSTITPVSLPVIVSLFRIPWAWLVFYLQTGAGLATIVALGMLGSRWPYIAILVLAPVAAAYMLIYARLLGRLGWLIVERLGTHSDEESIEEPGRE